MINEVELRRNSIRQELSIFETKQEMLAEILSLLSPEVERLIKLEHERSYAVDEKEQSLSLTLQVMNTVMLQTKITLRELINELAKAGVIDTEDFFLKVDKEFDRAITYQREILNN